MQLVSMVSKCPKCGRAIPADSVYCPYCGRGMKPSAKTFQVSTGGTLFVVSGFGNLLFFMIAIQALLNIYTWYPQVIAASWFKYDELLAAIALPGFFLGMYVGALSLIRKSYRWTMILAIICTTQGISAWILSMIIPYSNLWTSVNYYFLPLFLPPLLGTLLISSRKAEFDVQY
jgi:hypothetical protein